MDLDDDELEATRKMHGCIKDKKDELKDNKQKETKE